MDHFDPTMQPQLGLQEVELNFTLSVADARKPLLALAANKVAEGDDAQFKDVLSQLAVQSLDIWDVPEVDPVALSRMERLQLEEYLLCTGISGVQLATSLDMYDAMVGI